MVFVHRTSASGKSYNPVFADNDWATIIQACHANEVPETWVADGTCYKDMLIGDTNYRIDIIGSTTYSFAGEGKQYAYYQAGNSKVKNLSGSANTWWDRSPRSGNSAAFCAVGSSGYATAGGASTSTGVAFAFCF